MKPEDGFDWSHSDIPLGHPGPNPCRLFDEAEDGRMRLEAGSLSLQGPGNSAHFLQKSPNSPGSEATFQAVWLKEEMDPQRSMSQMLTFLGPAFSSPLTSGRHLLRAE